MVNESSDLKYRMLLFGLLLFLCTQQANSQATQYKIDTSKSNMIINGASNLKKWDADVPLFEGDFQLNETADTAMQIQFSCDAGSIDGGHGPDMNDKIKKALKAAEHPVIRFTAEQVIINSDKAFEGIGLLEIGGIQAPVEISGTMDESQIKGFADLKLSLFSIDPPTAMFGSIVCKDEIQIEWTMEYSKSIQ